MVPEIRNITPKQMVGMQVETTLDGEQTQKLWQSFMPLRNQIPHREDELYYALQIYSELFDFAAMTPQTAFIQRAAVEVIAGSPPCNIAGLQNFTLPGGLYAVFVHSGPAAKFIETLQTIHQIWLPSSDYRLDQREHFQVLEETWHPDDPEGREEVYIPVVEK